MTQYKHKRKIINFILNPGFQFRQGLYFFLFVFLSSVLVQWLTFVSLRNAIVKYQVNRDTSDLLAWIDPSITALGGEYFIFLGLFAVIGFAFGIFITHKVIGPTIAMKRLIRNLKDGEYGNQIYLRKGDQLRDLAEELNNLSIHLATIHPRNKAELHLITGEDLLIEEDNRNEKKSA